MSFGALLGLLEDGVPVTRAVDDAQEDVESDGAEGDGIRHDYLRHVNILVT